MGILEDMERQRQMLDAQAKARMAQEDYNRSQEAYSAAQNSASGGGLADVLKNAWNGITSGATSLWNASAGAVNAALGGMQTAAHRQHTKNLVADASNKRNEIARKYGYNSYSEAMNDDNASQAFWDEIRESNSGTADKLNKSKENYVNSDTYKNLANMSQNKYGADAIRGENFLADVLTAGTGGGLASALGVNTAQGALGGIADQLEATPDGEQFDWGEAGKRALSSAVGGAVGTLVGGKAAKLSSGSNLGKLIGSNVGRGVLAGAASGAASAGTQTALEGGDLAQVLGNAANAGKTGALYGGITSGAMGLANRGFNKISDVINKERTPNVIGAEPQATPEPEPQRTAGDGEVATGWGDKNMTGSARKRNSIQKLGDALQDTGQKTQDQTVIGKLKGNLADEMSEKNSVQRLRDIGFEPSDYEQAANLSEVANKWYDDQVKASKVKLDMPDTYKIADEVAYYRQLDADQAAKLKADITKRLDAVRATGGGLSTFDAAGLEKVAKGLGQDAERMTTTNYGGRKKYISNLSANAEAYANALNDVKAALRSKVDDMTDYNPDTLRSVLKDAGATQKQIDYLTDAKSMAQVKRNTSLLEDARNMSRQIKSSPFKRGANADASTSIATQAANASGVSGLLNMLVSPIAKGVGKVEKGVGRAISSAGDIVAGDGGSLIPGSIANKVAAGVDRFANSAINTTNLANSTAGDLVGALTSAAQRNAIRQNAVDQAKAASDNMANQETMRNAQSAMDAAKSAYDAAQKDYTNAQAMAPSANAGMDRLDQITRAMDMALAAGDLDSYSKLASLYQTAYKIYSPSAETQSGNKLTKAQQTSLDEANNSLAMVDQLEQAYKNAGGGKGFIQGGIGELLNNLTGGNANADLSTYNALRQSIGTSIVKNVVNLGGTEEDAQRYLAMLPSATDTQEQASKKLEQLRIMLNNMKANIGTTA